MASGRPFRVGGREPSRSLCGVLALKSFHPRAFGQGLRGQLLSQ